jgi:predicted dehydrogenase
LITPVSAEKSPGKSRARPRLGFLGVGWIGRHRMNAILQTGVVKVAAIADPSPEMAKEAGLMAPDATLVSTLDDLLDLGVDGVVIATPSAMHAEQSLRALGRAVVDAARVADRLLCVDLSYRFTQGMSRIREVVRSGELGLVYAVDLVFHNAYGPDKAWFYDPALSGGGCVMDLGVHLVDLALWTLDHPEVSGVSGKLFAGGEPLNDRPGQVEDHALATLELETGTAVRLACSWRLQAGCDAIISASFYGTQGGAGFRNVDGSFYDFMAERYRGTARETLATPPDEWGGRAAADWATRLAAGERFDPAAERLVDVARVLDRIYGR